MTPSPLERLKSSRIVQALLVYLGAAWVVLQLAEALTGLLELPAWVGPVVVIFLGIGFVVVLATAWVQALPETTAKERTGEVPTDWQVKPGDVLGSLRRGRLPHLTWGRALVGGVVALSILFGVAGIFVAVGGNASRSSTATGDGTEPLRGITVLPFHLTGPQLELYREGMVDLVSANPGPARGRARRRGHGTRALPGTAPADGAGRHPDPTARVGPAVRDGLRRRTGRLTAASGGLVDRPRRRPGAARHGASVRGQEAAPPTRPTR